MTLPLFQQIPCRVVADQERHVYDFRRVGLDALVQRYRFNEDRGRPGRKVEVRAVCLGVQFPEHGGVVVRRGFHPLEEKLVLEFLVQALKDLVVRQKYLVPFHSSSSERILPGKNDDNPA